MPIGRPCVVLELFGVPWSALDLAEIQRFLASAEPEPLQWEAKGTVLDPHAVRKASGAFANSVDGGYLILGAHEDKTATRDTRWTLSGVAFPDEPKVWVSNTIAAGSRPPPTIDVRSFPTDGERFVVVVWVPPIPDPPCVTRGTVYERLPGKSEPVKDPQRLAELYGRGQRAHATALARAATCSDVLMAERLDVEGATTETVRFSLGLSTIGYQSDISSQLFTEVFADTLFGAVEPHVQAGPFRPNITKEITQHAVAVRGVVDLDRYRRACHASAAWDGSVGMVCDYAADGWLYAEVVIRDLEAMWRRSTASCSTSGASARTTCRSG